MPAVPTSAQLKELRRPRPYPAVSILMPTHRREPDSTQDPVRLRNLVAEAHERLKADENVTREARIDVGKHLDQALAEVDLVHAADGLAIFVAPGEHQVWYLARDVPARVVLSDTFLTRNLVSARIAGRPYWVMAVAADHVSLWEGVEGSVHEQNGVTGFPFTRSMGYDDVERFERKGDTPSTFRDEDTRKFLRDADAALAKVLAADPRPLYLTGDSAALSLLDDVGVAAKGADAGIVHGGLAKGPADAVAHAVEAAVREHAKHEVDTVLTDLDAALGRQTFAAGLDEVWQSVDIGRAGLVAVEEGYRTTMRDDGDHLVPAESGDNGARDDIVDEVIERALDTDATVRFVPDGSLEESGRIAAALRY